MTDKLTVAEAIELANQDTAKLTNEQLTQMNEAFAESLLNQQTRQPNEQIASDVTIAEIDARLKALAENQNPYDEQDLDSIIAMAESVGMFSQNSEVAKKVLEKAKAQKDALQSKTQENEQTKTEENTAESNASEENTATPDLKDQIEIENTSSENQSDSDTLTVEEDQALKKLENTPEDQAELDKFDKENGIDTVTQEQLEANDNILDIIPHPLALGKDKKLLNQEFNDEIQALQNLTITDDKGNQLSTEEQNQAQADLISAALLEARTQTRVQGNGKPEDVKKLYYDNFKDALQRNIVSAVFASEINKEMTQEQLQEKFAQAVQNPQKAKISSIIAVASNCSAKAEKLVDRLKAKFKSIPVVQKMEKEVQSFDQRMTERYGKNYEIAKRFSKAVYRSLKNVGIYTVVGATAGPVGLGVLAVKSAYDSTKALQAEAKKNGMSFWQYAKENKAKVALSFTMSGLSIATAAMGMGVGGPELASKMQPFMKTITRGLAVGGKAAPALWQTAKAGWKRFVKKDKKGAQEEWKKAKESWVQTAEAAVGMVTGAYAADLVSEYMPNKPEENTSDNSNNASNNANNNSNNVIDRDNDGIPDTIDRDGGAGWANVDDRDNDGVPDTIDRDGGAGWANEENYTEDQKFWDQRADQFLGEQTTQDLYARIASGELKLPEGIETPQEYAYKLAMAMEQTPGLVAQDLGVQFQNTAQFEAGINNMTPEQFEKLHGLMNEFDDRGHYVGDREVNLQNTQHDNQENRGQPDNQENRENSNPRASNEPEQTGPFDLKKMEGVGLSQAQTDIPQEINHVDMPVHPSTEGLDMPTHQEIRDIVTELKQQYEQTGKVDLVNMMREQYANGDISEAKLKAITTIFNDVYDAKGNDVLETLDHIDKEASQAAEEERAAVLEAAQHPIINDKANEETIVSESSLSMDSKVGAIDYTIDSNGNYTIDGGNMSATGDYEAHQALTENILKNNPNLTLEDAQVQANKVILENQICSDLENRVANGEAIPGAEKFIEEYNTSLRESGFMRDQDGNIVELNTQEKTAENSQTNTEEKTAEPKAEEKTSEQKALEEKVNRFVDEKIKSGELDASKAEEMKDKLIKEVSQPEEKSQEVKEKQQESTKEDNDIVEHAKINYSLDEDGYLRSVNAQYSIDKNSETYETISNNLAAYRENNRFSFADLSMPRSADQLLIYNEVYSDIKEDLDKGEKLSVGEEKFMKQYEQNLQKLGLARDEDGNIVKANANSGKQMEQAVINAALQQNKGR